MSDDRLIELVRAVRAAYYDGLAEGMERGRRQLELELAAALSRVAELEGVLRARRAS